MSSEEHDEALMLEAAMFGNVPDQTAYRFGYPHRQIPRPPSPTLTAQRLLREQQDDEYLAALQADREKELKAQQEAEHRRLEEAAAREAALQKQKHEEEENHRKQLEEEELERMLAAKQASLPQEPSPDDENAVTLLVRMPNGSRRGRRFLKSDKLQFLFYYIDIGKVVKPASYRLVRPYPRRAFTEGESELSLSELGLTSKQEGISTALFDATIVTLVGGSDVGVKGCCKDAKSIERLGGNDGGAVGSNVEGSLWSLGGDRAITVGRDVGDYAIGTGVGWRERRTL
ncbi:hypothetical protein C4D60_Mb11t06490 [Musa balbisiana]|uniref:UBX domain-containing protein n=1 Tax=Musa balbisiana TaxID=52838 RepID=A0A4S8J3P3_MUSBA|nr:hypothetical protein C4D60_Mb11t06490 [Musa balbisiana]